jgi:hypothetical protein
VAERSVVIGGREIITAGHGIVYFLSAPGSLLPVNSIFVLIFNGLA